MEFAQISDRVEKTPPAGPNDLSAFLGSWVNANPNTTGIARIEISESGDKLSFRAFAIGPEGLIDWGATPVAVFTSGPSSRVGAGLTCHYDFGFAETRLQGMIMKGLLVLTQFNRFKDDSQRAHYFVREYFALNHGRY
jgi:hypothetical protein